MKLTWLSALRGQPFSRPPAYCPSCLDRWQPQRSDAERRRIHPRCWVALVRARQS